MGDVEKKDDKKNNKKKKKIHVGDRVWMPKSPEYGKVKEGNKFLCLSLSLPRSFTYPPSLPHREQFVSLAQRNSSLYLYCLEFFLLSVFSQ